MITNCKTKVNILQSLLCSRISRNALSNARFSISSSPFFAFVLTFSSFNNSSSFADLSRSAASSLFCHMHTRHFIHRCKHATRAALATKPEKIDTINVTKWLSLVYDTKMQANKTVFILMSLYVTHTHNRFTALLESVRDYPGEQVPER